MIAPIDPDDHDTDDESESEIDTTRVDVDPMLFGEFPDGPIEEVGDVTIGVDDEQEYRQWQREVALLRLTGACPNCDGPTNYLELDSGTEDVESWTCMDCWSEWFASE